MKPANVSKRTLISLATIMAMTPLFMTAAMAAVVDGSAGKLYIDDGGRGGLPVVFLHSFAGDTSHWAA